MQRFYPIVCTDTPGVTFEFNFGQQEFKFNLDNHLVNEANKIFEAINKVEIQKSTVFNLLSLYLYTNGHHDALISLEASLNLERSHLIADLKKQNTSNTSSIKLNLEGSQKLPEISKPSSDSRAFKPEKTSSFMSSLKKLFHKQEGKTQGQETSMMEDKPGTSSEPQFLVSDETAFLERSMIKKAIVSKKLDQARNLFTSIFPTLYSNHLGIQAMFVCLEFLNLYQQDYLKCLHFAKESFTPSLKMQKIQYLDFDKKVQSFELKVGEVEAGPDEFVCS